MDSPRTVILVGLERLAGKIDLEAGGLLRAVYKSEPQEVLQVMGADPPALVLVNTPFDRPDPVDFVSMARTCYPDLGVPIILLDLAHPAEGAIVNEYDRDRGSFYEREIPMQFLKQEIRQACGLAQEDKAEAEHESIRDIGRNEFVRRGDREFNIQTEIFIADTVKIKTTIFEGGVIIDNSVQTHSASDRELAMKVTKIAGSQHYEAVAKVRRGVYD